MSTADLRTYFNDRIQEIDPDLEAWDEDVFGNNDVTTAQGEKYYNLVIGTFTRERFSNIFNDVDSITLDIWATDIGNSNRVTEYDNLRDKAKNITQNILCKQKLKDGLNCFTDIELVVGTPIEEITSDTAFRVRIEFNAIKSYSY